MEADADLVRRALARDQQAFAALYDRYADKLYDYSRRLTGNAADAADIVQDTFVLAIQRLHQLRDPTLVRAWLYAIARSEVQRRHRRVNRLQFTEPDEQAAMSSGAPTADDLVHQQELRTLFTQAAHGLDPSDREVLDLHLRHSMTSAEIAASLGIPERQVSVVVQRVRERLGRSIGVVLLAKTPECAELAGLQRSEGSPLTVLSRKRLARHIEGCSTCSQQLSDRMRPEALLAAVPIALAPAFLRDGVLQRMAEAANLATAGSGSAAHGTTTHGNGSSGGTTNHGSGSTGGNTSHGNSGSHGNGSTSGNSGSHGNGSTSGNSGSHGNGSTSGNTSTGGNGAAGSDSSTVGRGGGPDQGQPTTGQPTGSQPTTGLLAGSGQIARRRRDGGRVWLSDGFPRTAPRRRRIVIAAIGAAALLVLFVVLVVNGGDSARRIAAAPTTEASARPAATEGPRAASTTTTTGTTAASTTATGGTTVAAAAPLTAPPITAPSATAPPATARPTTPPVTAPPTTPPALTTPPTTAPPTTTPPTTTPPTTAPDTSAPVFQSATASPAALSSAGPGNVPTCINPTALTSVITANVTDDRGVASVLVQYDAAGTPYNAALTKVGSTWQATIGPFPSTQVTPGQHDISPTFTVTDTAGNSTVATVTSIATVLGCTVIL